MKANLLFDFTVSKEDKTILVKREFNAPLRLVWKAWTTAELLDQWWGPHPWRAETKTLDFREGGHWLYAMVGPQGEKHWSKADYISIKNERYFSSKDGFCDENENMMPNFPENSWLCSFKDNKDTVTVECLLTFETWEDLETIIAMGFKEGFTTGLNQLEQLLPSLR